MTTPKRLSRKNAFFGLHFDLHPGKNDTQLGADITENMISDLLEATHPDYVQYDCKGHAGYTGYPTRIGWPSPGIRQDSLALWRKVTRGDGVALFKRFSLSDESAAAMNHESALRYPSESARLPSAACGSLRNILH